MKNKSGQLKSTPETDAEIDSELTSACYPKEYVSGEFARKLERERDEAREEAGHWKTEYEIVVDRLRGRKHPRDNGIIADDEIIPKLERERDEAMQSAEAFSALAWKLERERDEAIAARKASATDWLNQIEQANARVSRALQQVALVERERDEAREAIIPFITLNPKSQRVQKKWNGFVEAAKKALEGAK